MNGIGGTRSQRIRAHLIQAQLGGFGTSIEGEFQTVCKVIEDCHDAIHGMGVGRIVVSLGRLFIRYFPLLIERGVSDRRPHWHPHGQEDFKWRQSSEGRPRSWDPGKGQELVDDPR